MKFNKKIKNQNQGQVAILLSVLLMSLVLVIGLGLSTLMIQQLKLVGQMGHSVTAFYAANAGAEKCLYRIFQEELNCPFTDVALDLDGVSYTVIYTTVPKDKIVATGQFKNTNRALQISF